MKKVFLSVLALLAGFVPAHATILLWHPDLGNGPTGHMYISNNAQTYEIPTTNVREPAPNAEAIRNSLNQQLSAGGVTWLSVRDIRSDVDTEFMIILSVSANTTLYARSVFFGTNGRMIELTQRGSDDGGVNLGIPKTFSILPGSMNDIPLSGSNFGVIYRVMESNENQGKVIATLTGTGGPITFRNLYLSPGYYWIENVRDSGFQVKYWEQFDAILSTTESFCRLDANGDRYRLYIDYFIDGRGNKIYTNEEDALFYFEGIFSEFDAGNSYEWNPQLQISYNYDPNLNMSYIQVTCPPNLSGEEARGNTCLSNINGQQIRFVQTDSGEVEEKIVTYTSSAGRLIATIPTSQYGVSYKLFKNGVKMASGIGTGKDLVVQTNIGTGEYQVKASYDWSTIELNSVSVVGSELVEMAPNRNWILSTRHIGENQTVTDAVYYDGLGYPRQTVSLKASALTGTSTAGDLVQQVEYDSRHREIKSYLPYFIKNNNGRYVTDYSTSQDTYYKQKFGVDTPYSIDAYSTKQYDDTPLNRQQIEYMPGHELRTDERAKRFNYDYNAANRVLRIDANDDGSITVNGHYALNSLFCNETLDEDSMRMITYTDKTGRVLLQTNSKQTAAGTAPDETNTYYIYDNLDRLAWVISPEGAANLTNRTYAPDSDLAKNYSYLYTYDKRGRIISKKLPGSAPIYLVYDRADRVVMEQDGNMRAASQWRLYKYDKLGRPSKEYFVTTTDPRDTLQASFDQYPQNPPAYNITTGRILISESKYDTYSVPTAMHFQDVSGITTSAGRSLRDTRVKGVKTSSTTGIINSDDTWEYLNSAFYYDYMGRIIQTVEQDPYGGLLRISMLYDFAGNVLTKQEQFTAPGINDTFISQFTYDSRGRMLQETSSLNGHQSAVVAYTYDELGRMVAKHYGTGNNAVNESMEYNLQGWMTRKASSLLDLKIRYYDPRLGNAKYAGTISEIEWTHKKINGNNDGPTHMYTFNYDQLNRLYETTHYQNDVLNRNFNETDYRYDRNGNIRSFSRTDDSGSTTSFSFNYTGNQRVNPDGMWYDAYEYDLNGNLTQDPINDLNIQYNFLNLPKASYPNWGELSFRASYLADGRKYSIGEYENNGYAYRGSLVYEHFNGELYGSPTALFSSGYISSQNGVHYNLTDHLGSNRVIVNASTGLAAERNDFYPFGHKWWNSQYPSAHDNRYRYNGKEDMTGFEFPYYDYGARVYDPNTGIWPSVDPLAEKYYQLSPYTFCANNPLKYIDFDGKDIYSVNRKGALTFEKSTKDKFDILVTTGTDISSINDQNSVRIDQGVMQTLDLNLEYYIGPKLGISAWLSMEFKTEENLKEVFEFLSQNTDIEWSKTETVENNGKDGHILTTSYEKSHEGGINKRIKKTKPRKIKSHSHNHPSGNSAPSPADKEAAKKNPNTSFSIYTKTEDSELYKYFDYN